MDNLRRFFFVITYYGLFQLQQAFWVSLEDVEIVNVQSNPKVGNAATRKAVPTDLSKLLQPFPNFRSKVIYIGDSGDCCKIGEILVLACPDKDRELAPVAGIESTNQASLRYPSEYFLQRDTEPFQHR